MSVLTKSGSAWPGAQDERAGRVRAIAALVTGGIGTLWCAVVTWAVVSMAQVTVIVDHGDGRIGESRGLSTPVLLTAAIPLACLILCAIAASCGAGGLRGREEVSIWATASAAVAMVVAAVGPVIALAVPGLVG